MKNINKIIDSVFYEVMDVFRERPAENRILAMLTQSLFSHQENEQNKKDSNLDYVQTIRAKAQGKIGSFENLVHLFRNGIEIYIDWDTGERIIIQSLDDDKISLHKIPVVSNDKSSAFEYRFYFNILPLPQKIFGNTTPSFLRSHKTEIEDLNSRMKDILDSDSNLNSRKLRIKSLIDSIVDEELRIFVKSINLFDDIDFGVREVDFRLGTSHTLLEQAIDFVELDAIKNSDYLVRSREMKQIR